MSLNVSKGNMYGFVTHTWNTVKGKCPHGCTYCYMTRWGEQKQVRFDLKELKTDLGSGNFIFVGSSCDMFAMGISVAWIELTLDHCKKYDNRYFFQSKNPVRIMNNIAANEFDFVACATLETNRWYPKIMRESPRPVDRVAAMAMMTKYRRQITIEPIMDFDLEKMVEFIQECEPEQVNIGADSGRNDLPEPSRDKILALIDALNNFTFVLKKKNLKRLGV